MTNAASALIVLWYLHIHRDEEMTTDGLIVTLFVAALFGIAAFDSAHRGATISETLTALAAFVGSMVAAIVANRKRQKPKP